MALQAVSSWTRTGTSSQTTPPRARNMLEAQHWRSTTRGTVFWVVSCNIDDEATTYLLWCKGINIDLEGSAANHLDGRTFQWPDSGLFFTGWDSYGLRPTNAQGWLHRTDSMCFTLSIAWYVPRRPFSLQALTHVQESYPPSAVSGLLQRFQQPRWPTSGRSSRFALFQL